MLNPSNFKTNHVFQRTIHTEYSILTDCILNISIYCSSGHKYCRFPLENSDIDFFPQLGNVIHSLNLSLRSLIRKFCINQTLILKHFNVQHHRAIQHSVPRGRVLIHCIISWHMSFILGSISQLKSHSE